MKAGENGLLDRLDNAFEPTPDRFHRRFGCMLTELQAQPAPKPRRLRTRTAVIVALIAALLCATAFALERLGILYFLTERVAGGMSTELAEAGVAPVAWQQCESERLSVTVRDIYMDSERLAVCAHIEPREPDAYRLLSETDIGTDGEHFDRIWWQGKVLSFGEWLPEGKEMLVVSGATLQIGDTRLPVSLDWVAQDQGETFSFEARLDVWGEAPLRENDGMMEAALLIQSHLYGGENEQSTVTFAFAVPQ